MIFNSQISQNPQSYLSQIMSQFGNGGGMGAWGFSPMGLMPWSSYAPNSQTQAARQPQQANIFQQLAAPSGTAGYVQPSSIAPQQPSVIHSGRGLMGRGFGSQNLFTSS